MYFLPKVIVGREKRAPAGTLTRKTKVVDTNMIEKLQRFMMWKMFWNGHSVELLTRGSVYPSQKITLVTILRSICSQTSPLRVFLKHPDVSQNISFCWNLFPAYQNRNCHMAISICILLRKLDGRTSRTTFSKPKARKIARTALILMLLGPIESRQCQLSLQKKKRTVEKFLARRETLKYFAKWS